MVPLCREGTGERQHIGRTELDTECAPFATFGVDDHNSSHTTIGFWHTADPSKPRSVAELNPVRGWDQKRYHALGWPAMNKCSRRGRRISGNERAACRHKKLTPESASKTSQQDISRPRPRHPLRRTPRPSCARQTRPECRWTGAPCGELHGAYRFEPDPTITAGIARPCTVLLKSAMSLSITPFTRARTASSCAFNSV